MNAKRTPTPWVQDTGEGYPADRLLEALRRLLGGLMPRPSPVPVPIPIRADR